MSNIARSILLLVILSISISAQTWQPESAVPTGASPRGYGAAINTGSTIYLMGGTPVDASGDAPVHRLIGGNWSSTTPLEGAFLHNGAAIDNLGRYIVIAGVDPSGDEGDSFVWTVADGNDGGIDSRSNQAPFQLFAVAKDDQNLVYSCGGGPGDSPTGSEPNSTRVERYDGTTDTWAVLAPMNIPVADACACFDGLGHILVFGGFDGAGVRTANVASYDIAANSWSDTVVPDLPAARSGARAVLGADGRAYVIGGSDGSLCDSTFALNPSTLTWSIGPNLATAREHFGCVLANDGDILVIGGSTTNTVESLFTPTCPEIVREPSNAPGFVGASVGFDVDVSGTPPFTFQWYRNGLPLNNGPTGTGSTIVGADTYGLGVVEPNFGDYATYHCDVSNACGSAISASANMTLRAASQIPTSFVADSIHPGAATRSVAHSVDGGIIGGGANYPHPQYGALSHPYKWDAVTGASQDLTPGNSVGGEIYDVKNGTLAGWWWWPYTVPQGTGYYKHAAVWENGGTNHINIQPTSWEIGSVRATDGQHHVGNLTYSDDYPTFSGAFYWSGSNLGAYRLDESSAPYTYVYAIENGWEYGSWGVSYNTRHAARWFGATKSYVDMNPPGETNSNIISAGDGQQVGTATIGGGGYWNDSAGSFVSLALPASMGVTVNDCESGLQVGGTSTPNGVRATVWRGTANSALDLHQFVSTDFSYSMTTGVDVADDGSITIVGYGYNTVTSRQEALRWRGAVPLLTQDTDQVSAMAGAVFHQYVNGDPAWAGLVYAIVGSASGSFPGVVIGNNQLLPLNPDFYLDYMVTMPNDWILPSLGYLDSAGRATATGTLPAGALYVSGQVTLNHVVVILTADGTGFEAISDAVPFVIVH
ncbi:MAG: hypothetical protein ACI97A_002443 [Planctomycetota bacterium]|jgi:hypothetical protein